ncbi:DUF402 domain-containing protein [Erysipelothrix sp. HDW6C]|uniref:DUF402 domain-containing protein n=1 Tax=Erysipelothrix sp. HDW6C TaxID=2714930 RepID=UPI0014090E0B|nr:DUF402 domain-containing protein [Erysipelothrix sp. HDW6C]QIK69919.1 DUF402 domain-containing protein [Erysipelothrix sp. HDW6C]
MTLPKVGEVIYIQSFKHDGSLHRTWSSGTVLDVDDEKIVFITYKTWVVESDGRRWFTREPAICFYYLNRWYNVISMIRSKGVYYYCNLASPSVYDEEALKNIDYDLDVKIFPDGKHIILDEDEFLLHQRQMNYSQEIIDIIRLEKDRLVSLVASDSYPFDEQVIYDYFDKYLSIQEFK